jgi:DNA polymerase I-like protein with 3'-5' exonuclease and polymerase domains
MASQLGLFVPTSTWAAPRELPSLRGVTLLGLDTETRDPRIEEDKGPGWACGIGNVVGISVAYLTLEGPRSWYLPFAHGRDGRAEGNLPPDQVRRWAESELAPYAGTLVGTNLLYDLGWLRRWGIEMPHVTRYIDISWIEALLNENAASYSLNGILTRMGLPAKNETMLEEAARAFGVDPKNGLHLLDPKFVGAYAERDALSPLEAWKIQEQEVLTQDRLARAVELEHSLIPCLLDMRWRGVRVDLDAAERARTDLMIKEQEQLDIIRRSTGLEVQIWENASVAQAFIKEGVTFPTTATGKPSFRAPWLEAHPSPLARALVAARQYHKAWRDSINAHVINQQVNGRLHGEFHPLRYSREGGREEKVMGVGPGRFSSSHPNLQQVPARHKYIGPLIRSLYLPEEGADWYALDYSQQEPRLTIHYAALLDFPGAHEAAAEFTNNPDTDYHQFVADITHLPRPAAKVINLGLPYTMGGAKFCRTVGLPTKWITTRSGKDVEVAGDEGQALLDQYHQRLPYMKKIMEYTKELADSRGFIVTLSGRRARFDLWEPTHRWGLPLPWEAAARAYGADRVRRAGTKDALNRLIQGGGADMIKYSLRDLHREGLLPHITIHDENGSSFGSPREAERARQVMLECVKLRLPLKVDVERGKSWGAAKPFSAAVIEEMTGDE